LCSGNSPGCFLLDIVFSLAGTFTQTYTHIPPSSYLVLLSPTSLKSQCRCHILQGSFLNSPIWTKFHYSGLSYTLYYPYLSVYHPGL
jgi:hypothetical protein